MKIKISLFTIGFVVMAATSISEAASIKTQPEWRLYNLHVQAQQTYHQREQDYIGYRRREELLRQQREDNERVRQLASELTSKRDYFGLGKLFYNNGYMIDAIEAYSKAIEVNPRDYLSYYLRAEAKSVQKDLRGAFADYDMVIAINPEYGHVYLDRGIQKFKLQDKNGSLQDFRSAARIYRKQGDTKNLKDVIGRIQYLFKVSE
jgi:tetratricopeptide (TPR) repeat protein